MTDLANRLQQVNLAIASAAKQAQRAPQAIQLLAVSKTFSVQDIEQAFQAGQRAFGENYVQEACEKVDQLTHLRDQIEWHFIGPLQSNKTRAIAQRFDWVHTVDRLKIAERLSAQRPTHLPALNICLQINISQEESKHGIAPKDALALAQAVQALPRLKLRGLMSIPQIAHDLDMQRKPHQHLAHLFRTLQQQGFPLDTLSIGMSDDLTAAILEGATIIRIGRAIFGNRHYDKSS